MRGFTLLELLIVVTVVGVLSALLMPGLAGALQVAQQVSCASNLRHVGVATQLYLKDHDGWFFPLRSVEPGGVLWYYGFEPAGSASRGEGHRELDRTRGRLYPYLGGDEDAGVCPAFNYWSGYKAKYAGKWWTYGVNVELAGMTSGRNFGQIRQADAARTALYADAAQVNTFQAPASRTNPLIEEWFYIQSGAPYVHFRHGGRANVLFADWHVEAVEPAEGSLNQILPGARIGYFDPARVVLRPRG